MWRPRPLISLLETEHTLNSPHLFSPELKLEMISVFKTTTYLCFSENYMFLPVDSSLIEFWVLEDISQNVHRPINVLRKTFSIVDCLFSGGVRIEMCSHILYFELQIVLTSV